MAIHVFGMTDDQIQQVSRIWDIDFVHRWHDHRSHGDIDWDTDTLILLVELLMIEYLIGVGKTTN